MNEKWITPQGNRSNSDLGYVPLTPKRVDPAAEWRRRAEFAEAQVQAVRDVCKTYHLDDSYPNRRKVVFLDRILRALDGADRA